MERQSNTPGKTYARVVMMSVQSGRTLYLNAGPGGGQPSADAAYTESII